MESPSPGFQVSQPREPRNTRNYWCSDRWLRSVSCKCEAHLHRLQVQPRAQQSPHLVHPLNPIWKPHNLYPEQMMLSNVEPQSVDKAGEIIWTYDVKWEPSD